MEGIWYQINARKNDTRKQNDQERHSLEMGWDGTGPTSDRWPMPREIYMSSTRWVVCLVNQPAEAAAVGDVMGAQNYRAYFVRNVTSDDRNGWLLSSLVAEAENHRRRRYGMAGEDGWNLIREEWMKCENDQRSRLVSSLALTFLFAPRGWQLARTDGPTEAKGRTTNIIINVRGNEWINKSNEMWIVEGRNQEDQLEVLPWRRCLQSAPPFY